MEKINDNNNNQDKTNQSLGGPKTFEGKLITRYNALKHGILSKEVLLPGESKKKFHEFELNITSEINPVGEIEKILVDRIVSNTWRLRRVIEVERMQLEGQTDDSRESDTISRSWANQDSKKTRRRRTIRGVSFHDMDTIMRYETTIEKSIYKALHELERLQARRKGESLPPPMSVDIDISNG